MKKSVKFYVPKFRKNRSDYISDVARASLSIVPKLFRVALTESRKSKKAQPAHVMAYSLLCAAIGACHVMGYPKKTIREMVNTLLKHAKRPEEISK